MSGVGTARAWWAKLIEGAGLAPAAVFVLIFALLPMAGILIVGILYAQGTTGITTVLFGPSLGHITQGVLRNSLLQGSASALLALAWGYPVGVFVGRHDFRGRSLLLSLLLVPFLLPVLVVVLGVQEVFGREGLLPSLVPGLGTLSSGLPAILTVNVFYNVSLVALFTVAGVEGAFLRLEEAVATLGGGPWRAFRDVWARPSVLGAAAGGLLTFLFSFLSFAPPLILGGYANWTVEDWIYSLFSQTGYLGGSPGPAAQLSLWVVVLLLAPSAAYLLLVRNVRTLGLGGSNARPPRTIRWRDPLAWPFLAATAALLGFVALLLGTVMADSFILPVGGWGTANWGTLFSARATATLGISTFSAVGNSLFFAFCVLAVVLFLGLAAGFARMRSPTAGAAVDLVSFVPLLISPIILALSLFAFYDGTLYSEGWVWVLIIGSQAALALPFGLQTLSLAFRTNPPGAREAASTLGATRWRAFLDTDVPAARPAIVTAALFAFAISLGEFTATNFLYFPPYATLPVELYVLGQARGFPTGATWALGALLVLLSLGTFLVIREVGRRVRL
jgi:thiamine transport system permease protein